MDLFSKNPPCPICGGKILWFLPSKIEGEYICDACHNKIDMEIEKKNNLTMQGYDGEWHGQSNNTDAVF